MFFKPMGIILEHLK